MNLQDITTWSVSKGVATPENKYDRLLPNPLLSIKRYKSIWINNPKWDHFEKEAQQHTYATDAPDGSYSADRFGEIIEQYFGPDFKWHDMDFESVYVNGKLIQKTHFINGDFETRQFLPFMHQVKEAESPKFGEAKDFAPYFGQLIRFEIHPGDKPEISEGILIGIYSGISDDTLIVRYSNGIEQEITISENRPTPLPSPPKTL